MVVNHIYLMYHKIIQHKFEIKHTQIRLDKRRKEDFSSNVNITFFLTSLYHPHGCTLLLLLLLSLDGWVRNICSLSALRSLISTHALCVCVCVLTCSTCNNTCRLSVVILQLILVTFITYLLYFHLYLTETKTALRHILQTLHGTTEFWKDTVRLSTVWNYCAHFHCMAWQNKCAALEVTDE